MDMLASLSWLDLVMDLAGTGLMFTAFFFFVSVRALFKLEGYRSIAIVCLATLLYAISSAMMKISLLTGNSIQVSFEYYRLKELLVISSLGLLPYFLGSNVKGPSALRLFNRILAFTGLACFIFFVCVAYSFPQNFLYEPFLFPAGGVEAKTGYLFKVSQALIALNLLYVMTIIVIDLVKWGSFRKVLSVPIGIFMCGILSLSAIWKGNFGYYIDPLASISFSRTVSGQLCLSIGLAFGYLNLFLKQAFEVSKSHDELEESRNYLHSMLYTDVLTGLPNRRRFLADLNQSLAEKRNSAVLLLDLDNFMEFNECFGDDSGDVILKSVSKTLPPVIPSGAALYRMGGDEFSVILNDEYSQEELITLAHRIRDLAGLGFKSGEKTHSFGIAIALVSVPKDGENSETVLSNAYTAMHEAKTGNSICRYSDAMKRDSLMRISTIQHLREDLRGGFFHMVYQPIHDRTGKVSSAEALLRWENKEASIGPDYFIPLLEASGLMPEMGELILRLVLKDLGIRIRDTDTIPLISINLSPQQLKIDGLGVSIANTVTAAGIALERIQFEVTESAFLSHAGVGVANLTYLRARGSPIAMDDFGTGYSNLGYLGNLPIDKIKVDQSFVRTVPSDQSAEGLLRALSDIGKSYNMKLVAEGVETKEQLEFLHAIGFDEYQGYLYSRPLPCIDFLRYIDEKHKGEKD